MPSRRELESLLARFQDSGDAELVGQLFEVAAPELLRRARKLVHNERDAEDLVQGVFLSVLTGLRGYDRERPALPYLYGVLRLQAKVLMRNRGRTATTPLEPSIAAAEGDSVESADFIAHLSETIAQLESPSREVVELYLTAQLPPRAIAQSLDRSPGTVRVQLHRGLARLRMLLPAGLGALLTTHVLSAQHAHATGQSKTSGMRRPRTPIVLGGAAALVCMGALVWRPEPATPHPIRVAAAQGEAAAFAHALDAPRQPGSASAKRIEIPLDVGDSAYLESTLTVQLQWEDETSTPAAAVGATLHPRGFDPQLQGRSAHTGADGLLEFTDLTPGEHVLQLDRGTRRVVLILAGHNALAIQLAKANLVRGRVVDRDGEPIRDAAIWVSARPRHVWSGQVVCKTDEHGAFELRGMPAMLSLAARAPGLASSPMQTTDARDEQLLQFRLDSIEATLTGTVHDLRGQPVPNTVLSIGSHPRDEQFLRGAQARLDSTRVVRTDDAGRFRIDGLTPGQLTAVARHENHPAAVKRIRVEPGDGQELRFQLQDGRRVCGRVSDPLGTPVRDAFVHARGTHRLGWAAVWTDADGRFEIPGMPLADVGLTVTAEGFETRRTLVYGQDSSAEVALEPIPVVHGRILAANPGGAPSAGDEWRICLDRRVRSRVEGPPPELEVAADGTFYGAVPGGFDLDRVFVSHARQSIWLEASCAVVHDGSRNGALEVLVPVEMSQRGTLEVPLEGVGDAGSIRLLAIRDKWTYALEVEAEPDVLRSAPLVPGHYTLFADSHDGSFPTTPLGAWIVAHGRATRTQPLRGDHGTLEYSFAHDGNPPRQLTAWLKGPGGCTTQLSGFAGRQALRPGTYRLSALSTECVPIINHIVEIQNGEVTRQEFELSAGQHCELSWQAASTAHGHYRITDAAGNVYLQTGRRPDARGLVSLDVVLAPGRYWLETLCASGEHRGSFDVVPRVGSLRVQPLLEVVDRRGG